MKSGDNSVSRDSEEFRKWLSEIKDRAFVQQTFVTRPGLVAREPVNGYRITKDYHGGPYDAAAFDLVQGMWDHEHCRICWFTITDGFTYWANAGRIKLLCDACHEALVAQNAAQ